MISFFENFRSKVVHAKLFSQRGLGYISVINSGMILFILLSNLERYGIDINITKWFFPIIILGIFALILLGYIEDKFGFYEKEISAAQKRNPEIIEILRRVKRIEKKIS